MHSQQVRRLAALIRGIESVMFTTINSDGSINSRPMVVQDFDFDGQLWFYTYRDSAKIDSIHNDSHVCAAFMDPASNRYISVSGTAEVFDDSWTLKKMWGKSFDRWFPDGPQSGLALICMQVHHAEAWDAPHSDVVESFSFREAPYKKIKERAHLVRSRHH